MIMVPRVRPGGTRNATASLARLCAARQNSIRGTFAPVLRGVVLGTA